MGYQLAHIGVHNTTERWHMGLDPHRNMHTRPSGLGAQVLGSKDRLDLLQKHGGGGGGVRAKAMRVLLG